MKSPECNDSRYCVYRVDCRCMVLHETFKKDGECSFAKPSKTALPYNLTDRAQTEPDNRQWWEKFPYYIKCKN